VLAGATLGRDCNICDGVFVEGNVTLGDRVTVKCGVYLWDGLRIGDDVFIGPNATFENDAFPRSKQYPPEYAETVIENGASLGSNCTILPGVRIGQRAMVGAGAVVTRDVPANAIVVGNPARISGYVDTMQVPADSAPVNGTDERVQASAVRGVSLHRLPLVRDMRGDLSVGEFERDIPFPIARYFIVFNVPSSDVRGEHAHRHCHQFLVCVKGSCSVVVDDGENRAEFSLREPNLGLWIPNMVWGIQYKYTADAILLVLASHPYDPGDYIRDFGEFLREAGVR
jgi:acetyltransferase-like isoleucine patch superfamily enzyme